MSDKTIYVIYAKIKNIFERFAKSNYRLNDKGMAEYTEASLGWYVHFEESGESIFLDLYKPALEIGDTVKISFERKADATNT